MTVSGPERCTRLPETSKLKKMEELEPWLLSGERHDELSLHPQDRRRRTPESCPLTSTHVPLHTFTKQIRTKDDVGRICREGRVEGRCLREVREPSLLPGSLWLHTAV